MRSIRSLSNSLLAASFIIIAGGCDAAPEEAGDPASALSAQALSSTVSGSTITLGGLGGVTAAASAGQQRAIRSTTLTEFKDTPLFCLDCGIDYHDGPVMTGTTSVYYIFYGLFPSTRIGLGRRFFDPNSTGAVLRDLASNIGGSGYYNINTTYHQKSGAKVQNAVRYGGSVSNFYSQGKTLSQADVEAVVKAALPALGTDPNGVYFVVGAADVDATEGDGALCADFCGYHSYFRSGSTAVKYSLIGNPSRCPSSCAEQWDTTPNDNPTADAMASIVAHELSEAVTDPELDAWYRSFSGKENADICAWQFGTEYTTASGARANVKLGARDFLLQQNYIQGQNRCALFYSPFFSDVFRGTTPLHLP
jgi:hypothetical protein